MEKERLVVASGNAHKLREIAQIFTEFEVVSQKQMGFDEDVEETGLTFAENALIKARAAAKALNEIVLADEISPDTCRFWDSTTGEKLDKDRFRRDMGGVEGAYQEMMRRVMGE